MGKEAVKGKGDTVATTNWLESTKSKGGSSTFNGADTMAGSVGAPSESIVLRLRLATAAADVKLLLDLVHFDDLVDRGRLIVR
jgi:hypothetical protein